MSPSSQQHDAASRSPLRLGSVVDDRYLIDGYIAQGGMSVVYRAIDQRLDRPVALKVLKLQFAVQDEFRQRFIAEAKTVANLQGPGIVRVSDQGQWNGYAFLVMDLIAGGTVRELLAERGPMPPYAAVAVLQPVVEALALAHSSGFIHRDIKPENILISHSGAIKVVDFGLVRAVDEETRERQLVGTLAYLAPEQLLRGAVDERCDVFAAGCVLYELLVGVPPFGFSTDVAATRQRLSSTIPPASAQRPGIPSAFDDLLARATAPDPEDRFANAQEMAHALKTLTQDLGLPPYTVPAPRESAEQTAALTALTGPLSASAPVPPLSPVAGVSSEDPTQMIVDGRIATEIMATTGHLPDVEVSEEEREEPMDLFPDDDPEEEVLGPYDILAARPRLWPVFVWTILVLCGLSGLAILMFTMGEYLMSV